MRRNLQCQIYRTGRLMGIREAGSELMRITFAYCTPTPENVYWKSGIVDVESVPVYIFGNCDKEQSHKKTTFYLDLKLIFFILCKFLDSIAP